MPGYAPAAAILAGAVPAHPALCGLALTLQAAHVGPVPPFALSNAQDLVLGVR